MPNTMQVIGSVASPLSGASTAPMMLAVLTTTVLLPPASACATASTFALRRARLSSMCLSVRGSASADIESSPGAALLAAIHRPRHYRPRKAAMPILRQLVVAVEAPGARMTDGGVARVLDRAGADLAERRT